MWHKLEAKVTAGNTHETAFWKQYINIMCTARLAHRLQKLLDHLNGVEISIQFTVRGKASLSKCTVEVVASIDKVYDIS